MKENVLEKISLPLELELYSIWGNLGKGWEIRRKTECLGLDGQGRPEYSRR